MDSHALKLFLSLARNLHFGRASVECHVSPSALSRSIQRLETQIGHKLLLRDNRSVSLTREGELFRTFASETLEHLDAVLEQMGASKGQLAGRISIFASVTAAQSFLPTVLSRFRSTYPDIHIQLETGYAVDAIQRLQQGIDVVVTSLDKSDDGNLVQRIIMSIPVKQISATVYSEVDGNEAVMSMVALGCGVGFIPRLVVEKSPLQSQVQSVKTGPDLADFHVGFCVQRKRLNMSPQVKAFWETIG
jgi:LysR family positive regulator for ilvC